MNYLCQICTKSMCDDNRSWFDLFRQQNCCSECSCFDTNVRSAPVDVFLDGRPDKSALNAAVVGIDIVRTEFLGIFEDAMPADIHVGNVFDRRGNPIEGWVTLIAEIPLAIRGGVEAQRRVCQTPPPPPLWSLCLSVLHRP